MKFHILVLIGFLFVPAGCAHRPPNLGPAGTIAWQNLEIAKDMDLVRDIATDANAQVPPILSTETTRKVVDWHTSAIQTLNARAAGWQAALFTGLDELLKNLSSDEQRLLTPYVALVKAIIQGVRS